jgi:hypothetical protein
MRNGEISRAEKGDIENLKGQGKPISVCWKRRVN